MIDKVEKNYYLGKFENYKVTYDNSIISFVPFTEENRHYQEIQKWAAIDSNNIIDNGA